MMKFWNKEQKNPEIKEKIGPFGEYFARWMERNQSSPGGLPSLHYHGRDLDRSRALGNLVLHSLSPTERRQIDGLIVCELPGREVNAYAGIRKDGKKVVITNHNLFSFIYASLNLWMWSLKDSTRVKEILRTAIRSHFFDDQSNANIDVPSDAGGEGGKVLRHVSVLCMELFIICHEFGHHLCGHIHEKCPAIDGGENGLEFIYKRDREDEYEADKKGFELYDRIMNEETGKEIDPFFVKWINVMAPQGKLGFDMFFSFVDLATSLMGRDGVSDKYSSHPPPLERRERLRTIYTGKYGRDAFLWGMADAIANFCIKNR